MNNSRAPRVETISAEFDTAPRVLLLPVVGDRSSRDGRRKGGRWGDSPLPQRPAFLFSRILPRLSSALTSRRGVVIVLCLMIWRRRCLVLVPVLSFLAAALIMSCGGGSTGSTTTSNSASIIGLNVCLGAPPTGTPAPTPVKGHTPTPTPTPICTPIVASAPAAITTGPPGNTVQFNAQGIFGFASSPKTEKFHDVTNSASTFWNPIAPTAIFPGFISYQGNGLFIGVTTGCTYFTVSDGGFAQSVVVGVNVDPGTCPAPPAVIVQPGSTAHLSPSP